MTWDVIETKWAEMAKRCQGHLPQNIDTVGKPVLRKQADAQAPLVLLVRGPAPARVLRDTSRK